MERQHLVITYNGNGAAGSAPSPVSQPYNSSFTLSNAGALVQIGYSFAGWNTAANGTGTAYSAGGTYVVAASNVTLYAQWTINSYSVTFSANGAGGSPPSTVTQNYNTSFTLPGAGSLTLANYTFAGWNTAANGTGTAYSAGNSYVMGASSVTLYAQWTIDSYSVTFSANGAGGSPPSTVTQNYRDELLRPGSGSLHQWQFYLRRVEYRSRRLRNGVQRRRFLHDHGKCDTVRCLDLHVPDDTSLAATVTVPTGVTALVSSSTNNMFSTSGIVTETWPTTVVLPSTLTNLGYLAFHDCYGLTSITIPSSVTTLGYGVFLNDSNVVVTMTSATPPDNSAGAFDAPGTALVIRVPNAYLSTYQTATNWSAYAGQMVGY